ncbi:MAG: hypothetical protein EHM23_34985 [Acidobacteria bacterium]|nr:MAG: hypothetical protein EHM23_34985 [Acidobacteriota bacterium]
MGVSIHYRGQIADQSRFQDLRGCLLQFADRAGWEYLDLTGPAESEILEIILYPPGDSEPVSFLFDTHGRLHPPYEEEVEGEECVWCSVKTQGGPLEAHVQIVELLKVIQRDYMPSLEVMDEGSYWETQNLESLRAAHGFLVQKRDLFSEALGNTEGGSSEPSAEDLCNAVEEVAVKSLDLEKRHLQ